MARISVLVLVYNVEQYLQECIESVLLQTYSDFELLLVDNGSRDHSALICNDYLKKDSRIRCLHLEKNIGVANARNFALSNANGEYVVFVDSDDFVDRRFLEVLYCSMKEENADASVIGFNSFVEKNELIQKHFEDRRIVVSGADAVKMLMRGSSKDSECWFTPHPWGKLYKKDLLEGIAFPTNRTEDDQFFTPKALYRAQKVVSSSEKLYNFRQRADSTMHQKFSAKRFDILVAMDDNIKFFEKHNEPKIVREIIKRKSIHQYECIVRANKMKVAVPDEYNLTIWKAFRRMLELIDDDDYVCFYVSKYYPIKAKFLSYILRIMRFLKFR